MWTQKKNIVEIVERSEGAADWDLENQGTSPNGNIQEIAETSKKQKKTGPAGITNNTEEVTQVSMDVMNKKLSKLENIELFMTKVDQKMNHVIAGLDKIKGKK